MLSTLGRSDIAEPGKMNSKGVLQIIPENLNKPRKQDDLIELYNIAVAKVKLQEQEEAGNEERAEDDDIESEFDVVLPNSELGKYMSTSGMSGYVWDEVDASGSPPITTEDSKDNSKGTGSPKFQTRWNKWGPTRGFLCGKQFTESGFKYESGIFVKLNLALQYVGVFLARVMDVFRKLVHILPWKASAEEYHPVEPKLETSRNVAHYFTTEYRLVQNSRVLAKKALLLQNTFKEMEAASLELSNFHLGKRQSNHYELLQRANLLKVKMLQKSANDQMKALENLLIIESRLVDKIQNSLMKTEVIAAPVGELIDQKTNDLQQIATDGTDDGADRASNDEKDTFEYCEAVTEMNLGHSNAGDEFFTAVVAHEDTCLEQAGPSSADNEEFGELLANQEAVMNQLRDSLRPRRSDMRQREKQAFIKIYGKDPEEEFDEMEENLGAASTSNILSSSSDSSFEIIPQTQDDEENGNKGLTAIKPGHDNSGLESKGSFVFGDEDSSDEEGNTRESSEFNTNLKEALREMMDKMGRRE